MRNLNFMLERRVLHASIHTTTVRGIVLNLQVICYITITNLCPAAKFAQLLIITGKTSVHSNIELIVRCQPKTPDVNGFYLQVKSTGLKVIKICDSLFPSFYSNAIFK